jgi:hypothetical protein
MSAAGARDDGAIGDPSHALAALIATKSSPR